MYPLYVKERLTMHEAQGTAQPWEAFCKLVDRSKSDMSNFKALHNSETEICMAFTRYEHPTQEVWSPIQWHILYSCTKLSVAKGGMPKVRVLISTAATQMLYEMRTCASLSGSAASNLWPSRQECKVALKHWEDWAWYTCWRIIRNL